jgi:hypothetical protein
MQFRSPLTILASVLILGVTNALYGTDAFVVTPAEVVLNGNFAQSQLLVAAPADERGVSLSDDLTGRATYLSLNEGNTQGDSRWRCRGTGD